MQKSAAYTPVFTVILMLCYDWSLQLYGWLTLAYTVLRKPGQGKSGLNSVSIWHVSLACSQLFLLFVPKTEKDRTQKCFAFSHTRLMYNDGTTLQDGTHELLVYKVSN